MKRAWHPDELAQCWTLSPDELELLSNKTGVTRLRFAVLLKAFQFDGRFPDRRADVAGSVVVHLASQIGVPAEAYFDGDRLILSLLERLNLTAALLSSRRTAFARCFSLLQIKRQDRIFGLV
jgi:Domain of unknown function (DUF4158)